MKALRSVALVVTVAACGLIAEARQGDVPLGEWRVTVEWPDGAREARMSVTRGLTGAPA